MKVLSAALLSLAVAGGAAWADCGKDHKAAKTEAKAGHSCAMHDTEKAAEKTADAAHACDHAGEKAAAKVCPMKDKTAAETVALEATGKVLCMKCNLNKEDKCRKVFQAAGKDELYAVCPDSDMDAIEKLSGHGSESLDVKGQMVTATDGTIVVKLEKVEKAKS